MSRTHKHVPLSVAIARYGSIAHDHRGGECKVSPVPEHDLTFRSRHQRTNCNKHRLDVIECAHFYSSKGKITGITQHHYASPRSSVIVYEENIDVEACDKIFDVEDFLYYEIPYSNRSFSRSHRIYRWEDDHGATCACDDMVFREDFTCFPDLSRTEVKSNKKIPTTYPYLYLDPDYSETSQDDRRRSRLYLHQIRREVNAGQDVEDIDVIPPR